MRVIIDSKISVDQKPGSWLDLEPKLCIEWETTYIITVDFLDGNNDIWKSHEIRVTKKSYNSVIAADKLMELFRNQKIHSVRHHMPIGYIDWDRLDIEIIDSAGILSWLRDMKEQAKEILKLTR